MLSRFHLIPESYGRTDILTISISRVSVLTHDKKQKNNSIMTTKISKETDSVVDEIC